MTRTQIQLPDLLFAQARKFAKAREMSLAEVCRRALELYLNVSAPVRDGETSKDEAMRLFPCATPDKTAMLVKAATLDDFRDGTLADKRMRLMRNGRETTPAEESARKEESKVDEVSPDPIVTCPKCGHRFRSHKRK